MIIGNPTFRAESADEAAAMTTPAGPERPGPRRDAVGIIRAALPTGYPIDDEVWARRHRGVLVLVWLHVAGLGVYGLIRGYPVLHLGSELAGISLVAIGAGTVRDRTIQASLGTLGLVLCSALLVHLSGGLIEAHFHFFIVVMVVTLYQSWVPFTLALVFVVIHHGTVGVVDPGSVYNHHAAIHRPWLWAGVHGLFIAGAATAALASWKHVEVERERAEEAAVRLHDRVVRHREAIQINDTLVQGLVTAKYAAQLGDEERAAEAVERTLALAKQLVSDLMEGEADMFEPGGLRRDEAASTAIGLP
jgi:hypothetical protein